MPPIWRAFAQRLKRAWLFGLKVLAVPIGLAGAIGLAGGLTSAVQKLGFASRIAQIWLCVVGMLIVVDALLAFWDRLPQEDQHQALERWQGVTDRLLLSRTLSLWPVLLVLLTSLVGLTDWFPPNGPDRLMMLASITTVAIYGYFREKAEKRKDLLAFANEARDRFAQAAKQIHEERDREIEERDREIEKGERSAEIDRLISDFEDNFSELKTQAEFLRVPFRDLVDTSELRDQLNNLGFSPTDAEFNFILTKLGLGN
jgi:hypothetical protein